MGQAPHAFVTMLRHFHGQGMRLINHAKGYIPILIARRIPVTSTRTIADVACGENQQVMVRFAVAQGTAESFHRRACIANLAMSLAFAQVPSQAPLLYDSCMTPV